MEYCKFLSVILSNFLFRLGYKLDILIVGLQSFNSPHKAAVDFRDIFEDIVFLSFFKVFYLKTKSGITIYNVICLFVIRVHSMAL